MFFVLKNLRIYGIIHFEVLFYAFFVALLDQGVKITQYNPKEIVYAN